MTLIRWAGVNEPGSATVLNRALRDVLLASGLDPDVDFAGFVRRLKNSDAEFTYWQDQAALLDPAAYVMYSGVGLDITVPADETWYSISQYKTNTATATVQWHQRVGDVAQATVMPPGFNVKPPTSAHVYTCQPARVIAADARYTDDPRGLYFQRRNMLRTLAKYRLDVLLPATLNSGQTATGLFPADFEGGMLVALSVYDAAWVGMQYYEGAVLTGAMNLMHEINNNHSLRFAQGVLMPFKRSVMPGTMGSAGRFDGATTGASVGGGVTVEYVKLPAEW